MHVRKPGAIRRFIGGVGAFFSSQWAQYNPLGQLLFALALGAIAVDAGVAYKYGVSMTALHGLGFAIVAIAFCILPDVASMEWKKDNRPAAFWIGVACLPLGVVAFQSHLGYGAGVRLGQMQTTGFHQAVATDAKDAVDEDKRRLEWAEVRLADLQKANPWAASVSADKLLADVRNAEGDRVFKRSKQCTDVTLPESRRFCDAYAETKGRLANVSEMNKLVAMIDSTKALVAKSREKVETTGVKPNTVTNQNNALASIVNVFRGVDPERAIKPTETEMVYANTGIMGVNTLGFLIAAPILMFAAGRNRKPGVVVPEQLPSLGSLTPRYPATEAPATYHTAQAHQPAPVVINALQPQRVDTSGLARRISRELGSIPLKRAPA